MTLSESSRTRLCISFSLWALLSILYLLSQNNHLSSPGKIKIGHSFEFGRQEHAAPPFPSSVLFHTVYNASLDFGGRVSPPYWDCTANTSNASGLPQAPSCNFNLSWGPCFPPKTKGGGSAIQWELEVERYSNEHVNHSSEGAPVFYAKASPEDATTDTLEGRCRPGFLIIGAGKCGTSSLYHYLVEHPRVLPAEEKQIHYFKYFRDRSMRWYLRHFPTTQSFLASGALLTGEASPGYLPYPDVAHEVNIRMPGPRIIAIGRSPLERSYSSYRYNYANPTFEALRNGRVRNIEKGMSDEEYKKFIFSFEDMMKAELAILRECLARDGPGILEAKRYWTKYTWAREIYQKRAKQGGGRLPPLVDLDGFCYGDRVNTTVLRKQWANLVREKPGRIILDKNLHLVQSMIGRSLYALPLEWWYEQFSKDHIYFMCTEELRDLSGEPLSRVSNFLGLPQYNFSSVVGQGAFNVGGYRGYDNEVKWSTLDGERASTTDIPLSEGFKEELLEFFRPYNERLFELTGRRCAW